jgi:hypothetical protein
MRQGIILQSGRLRVRFPIRSLDFSTYPFSHTMAVRSAQPHNTMSTRNLPDVKAGRRVRFITSPQSVNPLSTKMWIPQRIANVWVSASCYRDGFTILPFFTKRKGAGTVVAVILVRSSGEGRIAAHATAGTQGGHKQHGG